MTKSILLVNKVLKREREASSQRVLKDTKEMLPIFKNIIFVRFFFSKPLSEGNTSYKDLFALGMRKGIYTPRFFFSLDIYLPGFVFPTDEKNDPLKSRDKTYLRVERQYDAAKGFHDPSPSLLLLPTTPETHL